MEFKRLYTYRRALWEMAFSQLKAKYSGSVLGIFWAVINPVLIMAAITFVFTVVFKVKMPNFHLFVLSGIFPWIFFSNAVSEATPSIIGQQNILRQFSVPIEIIPLSSILANFLNFLIGWLFIFPLFLVFHPGIIGLVPALVICLLLQLVFTCGLGLLLSSLNVFFRDISQLLGVFLMFWFWLTPVFYSGAMIPESFKWLDLANPMAYFVACYRDILYNASAPSGLTSLMVLVWTGVSFFLGWFVFVYCSPKILKKI